MDRGELIEELADRLGGDGKAEAALSAFVEIVVDQVAAGGKVAVTGFGTFEPAKRAARAGRNPKTGQSVRIPAARVPRFRAGRAFKDIVGNPRLLPDLERTSGGHGSDKGSPTAKEARPSFTGSEAPQIGATFIVT